MPNTHSAERRTRSNARKHARNLGTKTRLKTLEARFNTTIKAGKKEDALAALRTVTSALDKAAKVGVIHKANANRKKSRLSARIAAVK